MQAAAKATVRGIRAAAHAVMAAFKAAVAAMQSLVATLLAGGWVAVVIILLICLIALVMGSSYGIFFGVESTGSGTSVSQAVQEPVSYTHLVKTGPRAEAMTSSRRSTSARLVARRCILLSPICRMR